MTIFSVPPWGCLRFCPPSRTALGDGSKWTSQGLPKAPGTFLSKCFKLIKWLQLCRLHRLERTGCLCSVLTTCKLPWRVRTFPHILQKMISVHLQVALPQLAHGGRHEKPERVQRYCDVRAVYLKCTTWNSSPTNHVTYLNHSVKLNGSHVLCGEFLFSVRFNQAIGRIGRRCSSHFCSEEG